MDLVQGPMSSLPPLSRIFAVHGVFWRKCVDWVVINVPFYFHPLLIFLSSIAFFIAAKPARRTVIDHLSIIFPESSRLRNVLRAFRVFQNFAWTLTDAAVYRLLKTPFDYELEGQQFLDQLATGPGGIVLTAHMGNYDLGAAVFVEKLHRELRIIRAPEPDELSARHLDRSIEESGAGAVKVAYNTDSMALSFDLLKCFAPRRNRFDSGRSCAWRCLADLRHDVPTPGLVADRTICPCPRLGRAHLSAFRYPIGISPLPRDRAGADCLSSDPKGRATRKLPRRCSAGPMSYPAPSGFTGNNGMFSHRSSDDRNRH